MATRREGKNESLVLRKAVSLLTKDGETINQRYSQQFFEKVDMWKRVFELRSQGLQMSMIAKTLGITRKTCYSYYHRFVELQTRVSEGQLSVDQMKEITEYLLRLEHQREEVAFELASMNVTDDAGRDDPQKQMVKLATRKVLLDLDRQIANTKRGLGIWHSFEEDHFARKTEKEKLESTEDRKARLMELMKKAGK